MLASRTHEAECLAAENKRLASDWKLREDGLTGSHEIRIEHLMNTLKQREQQNCDLHNQLHNSNVAIESLKAEVATTRQDAKVCALHYSALVCKILFRANPLPDRVHVCLKINPHRVHSFQRCMAPSGQHFEYSLLLDKLQTCGNCLPVLDR
jgi:hypothetical protein